MLTERDIDMMQEWRDELTANRVVEVTLATISTEEDFLTGELIETESEKTVDSVVTERASRTAAEIFFSDGAEVREGDLWFSVSIKELTRIGIVDKDGYDSLKYAYHGDEKYRIVSWDRKGIGRINRLEFLGKAVV